MEELYHKYRRLLFVLAYQMTGSAADAEDAVQDVFMKVYTMAPATLEEPKAYLCKMVTNRCLDLLKSARRRRERYVGPWLPEPLPSEAPAATDAMESIVRQDLLSYAMLVLLERLTPAERAVFVLREGLGFDYPAIAKLTGKGEANCRKLLSRAKGRMGISEEETVRPEAAGEAWVRRFMEALGQDNVDGVLSLLAEDVELISDGGGKVIAALRPIASRDQVARFLLGLIRKMPKTEEGFELKPTVLNGQAAVLLCMHGAVVGAALARIEQGQAINLYIVRNPDKLTHFQSL